LPFSCFSLRYPQEEEEIMHRLPATVFQRLTTNCHTARVTGTNLLAAPQITVGDIQGVSPRKAKAVFENYGEGQGELLLVKAHPTLGTNAVPREILEANTFCTLKYQAGSLCFIQVTALTCTANHVEELTALAAVNAQIVRLLAKEAAGVTDGRSIIAPMMGTIYWRPKPGDPPFVAVGQHVESGQTLCLLEAMKTFNEVTTPHKGVITELVVDNDAMVEQGQVLCYIKDE
jgi:acetyl-CoA carboxylase biotin carboxyl carrier protein